MKKKNVWKSIAIILICCSVILLAGNLWLYKLADDASSLYREAKEADSEGGALWTGYVYYSMYDRICMVNEGSKEYHKYGCEKWDRNGSFSIYDTYTAGKLGYYPCSKCH